MPHDSFDMLGLPAVFDLDDSAIDRAYLARAATLHPDLAGEGDEVQARAAALNRARDELRDPERRAAALLQRLGGPGKSQDQSLPEGFLMEIMETRERIEEAMRARDPVQRATWTAWAQGQREQYVAAVAGLFRTAAGDQTRLREIRRQLNAWRYIERLIEQLDPEYDPAKADWA